MNSDRSLLVVRLLSALHGLPALGAVLYGTYVAGHDVLDGDTGLYDGLGTGLGLLIAAAGLPPLLLAVPAVCSSRPRVVRVLGGLLGVVGVTYALLVEYVPLLVAAPSLALLAVAVGSWLAADADRPVEA